MTNLPPKARDQQDAGQEGPKPANALDAWRVKTRALLLKTGGRQTSLPEPAKEPVLTPAQALAKQLAATDPAVTVVGLRADLAAVNAAGSVSRNDVIKQSKRRLITPAVAKLYVSAAVRAVAEMRRRTKGTSTMDDGIDRTEAGRIAAKLTLCLDKLQTALPRFFTEKDEAKPDDEQRARVLLMPNANKDMLRRKWNDGLGAVEGSASTQLAAAMSKLQGSVEEAEVERWAALNGFRETFGKTDSQGNWNLGTSVTRDHEDLLDAYVELVETLDGIRDGALVKAKDGALALSTKNLAKAKQVDGATGGPAPSMASTADVLASTERAVAGLNAKQKGTWDAIVSSVDNTMVIGGYEFIGGVAGLSVVPPDSRKQARYRVLPKHLGKAMDKIQELRDRKIGSGATLGDDTAAEIDAVMRAS